MNNAHAQHTNLATDWVAEVVVVVDHSLLPNIQEVAADTQSMLMTRVDDEVHREDKKSWIVVEERFVIWTHLE